MFFPWILSDGPYYSNGLFEQCDKLKENIFYAAHLPNILTEHTIRKGTLFNNVYPEHLYKKIPY